MKNTAELYLRIITAALPAIVAVVKENPQLIKNVIEEIRDLIEDENLRDLFEKYIESTDLLLPEITSMIELSVT